MPNDAHLPSYTVRLETILNLRWLTITGQIIVLVIVALGFGFPVKLNSCLALIAVAAVINIVLQKHYPKTHRLTADAATALFAVDIVLFTLILHQTGGLSNPFAMLYVGPVIIGAAALPPNRTAALGTLTIICSTFLLNVHQPMPWHGGRGYSLPLLHVAGIWTAIVLTVLFCALFTLKIASDNRKLTGALLATERTLEREHHLSSLDGMAAAAAHELGTPLSTIALVAQELANCIGADIEKQDDLKLILDEIDRCRTILTQLSNRNPDQPCFLDRMSLDVFMNGLIERQRARGRTIVVSKCGDGPEPEAFRNPGIVHALNNIIDNAAEYASSTVYLRAIWTESQVALEIRDDGPGFGTDILPVIGEPYVSTRRTEDRQAHSTEGGGLGLGMFIAKTLLERTGAQLTFQNAMHPQTGAITRMAWSRADFAAPAP